MADETTKTPNLKALSKALALKLRDPVGSGSEDGIPFKSEDRQRYLSRAFGKLVRNLQKFTDDIEYIFPSIFGIYQITHDKKTDAIFDPNSIKSSAIIDTLDIKLNEIVPESIFKIYSVYIVTDKDKKVKGNKMTPSIYVDATNGTVNDSYAIDETKNIFYYTMINGSLRFYSNSKIKAKYVTIFAKSPIPEFVMEGQDLFIPGDYKDLLLSLAALEASMDTKDPIGVKIYQAEFDSELSKIAKAETLPKKSNDITEE